MPSDEAVDYFIHLLEVSLSGVLSGYEKLVSNTLRPYEGTTPRRRSDSSTIRGHDASESKKKRGWYGR
jgi:hypothetical protein